MSTSDNSIKAIDEYISKYEEDRQVLGSLLLQSFFKIFERYRRIERFITPTLNTLACFYRIKGLFDKPYFQEKSLKMLEVIYEELIDTKFAAKLVAGSSAAAALIDSILSASALPQPEKLNLFRTSKMLSLTSHLLNHE